MLYNVSRIEEIEVGGMASSDSQVAKNVLQEIATHAYTLAMGLQNIAPAQDQAQPAKSIQYLLDTAAQLAQTSQTLNEMFPSDGSDKA